MQISAYFERIVFVNDGFAIVKFSTNDESASKITQSKLTSHKSKYVFSAFLYGFDVKTLMKNIGYLLEGSWNKNSRGFYFKVDDISEQVGNSEDEIITYLCSFEGIGLKTATKIYKSFKNDTVDIVENRPEELRKIKVKKKVIENIKASVQEKSKKREVIQFLSQFSLSARKINKILDSFDLYKIMDIVKANPFFLSQDGAIDFVAANSIAIDLNVALASKERIQQAIIFVINNKFRNEGDLIVNVSELIDITNKSLNNNCTKNFDYSKHIDQQIKALVSKGELIYFSPKNHDFVYLYKDYGAEKYAANKMIDMMFCPNNVFNLSEDETLPLMQASEKKNKIKLSPAQEKAVIKTMSSNISVITGGPGTGKSTLLKIILDVFRKKFGNNIGLCAPTGKAARRMAECTGIQHACTIHSLLGIEEDHYWTVGATNTCQVPFDLIVVDEISMLDMSLMYLLIESIPYTSKVILLGDSDQLPSVGPGAVLKEIISSKTIPVSVLDKIYRQSEQSTIIMNSYKLNNNSTDFDFDESFLFINKKTQDVSETISKIYINELKKGVSKDDIQILTPFKNQKYTASVPEINNIIQSRINPANGLCREIKIGNTVFRLRDRVIQQKNTEEIKNGDIGTILDIKLSQGVLLVVIDFGFDRIVEYTREEMEDNQLDLAYAITAHKSQGSEYRTIIMPVISEHAYMLKRKLIYTAWTRAKEKVILVGSKNVLISASANTTEKQRYTAFSKRLQLRYQKYKKKRA